MMYKTIRNYYQNITTKYPQSFTGKERDSETGFSYFGARYYDSDILTGWLSVDPMADDFLYISPYNYCNWNPVKLKDPDGNIPLLANIIGAVVSATVEAGMQLIEIGISGESLSKIDFLDIGLAAAEGFLTSGTNVMKKVLTKTGTHAVAKIASISISSSVDFTVEKGFTVNNKEKIAENLVENAVQEIGINKLKLPGVKIQSANKAVNAARTRKGSLPTAKAKQIAEKQNKSNTYKKAIHNVVKKDVKTLPSKVVVSVKKGCEEQSNK